jgi:replicative DNA helicase
METPYSVALNAPYSAEAERALIGSIIIEPHWFARIRTFLPPDDFFLTRHSLIWQTIERMLRRGDQVSFVTLVAEFEAMKVLDDIGGRSYILQLINETDTSMYAEVYAQLVSRLAARRRLMEMADQIKQLSTSEENTLEQIFDQSEAALMKLRSSRQEYTRITMEQAMQQADALLIQRINLYNDNPDYTLGVKTGFRELDKALDGLPVGITTLAGMTGMGKTACVLTIAMNASKEGIDREEKRAARVNLFSGEMTQEQLNWRILAMKSGIPVNRISRGALNDFEQGQYLTARDSLVADHALTFESMKRMSVHQIRDTVRMLVKSGELDLMIIDGLLQIDTLQISQYATKKERGFQMEKRRDAIEYILNEMEDITATYDTRILLTHQISRAPSARQNKRPMLSDLAEANFVEQKSSVVLFLYREGYFDPAADPEATEMIIAKNRNGLNNTIPLVYNRQFTRFEDGIIVHVDLNP